MTNCPNCGAPITGPRCEYCGTQFERRHEVAPERWDALQNSVMNLQARLNEANAQMANTIQTQYILSNLQQWTAEPCAPVWIDYSKAGGNGGVYSIINNIVKLKRR